MTKDYPDSRAKSEDKITSFAFQLWGQEINFTLGIFLVLNLTFFFYGGPWLLARPNARLWAQNRPPFSLRIGSTAFGFLLGEDKGTSVTWV